MNNDNEVDPFAKRKRANKTTKRRRRTERGDINADSEDEEEKNEPLLSQKFKAKRGTGRIRSMKNKSRSKPLTMPKDLYEEVKPKIEDDDEEQPDYSIAGLQRLRQLTSNKPPKSDSMVIDVEDERMSTQDKVRVVNDFRKDARSKKLERKTFKCEACGKLFDDNDVLQLHLTNVHINPPSMGFLEREREKTEDKLGLLDDMEEYEMENVGSDAEEWEREQLRRAGLSVSNEVSGVTDNLARAVIEEEDVNAMNSLKDDLNTSVVDSFFASIQDANHAAINRKSELQKKLSLVSDAIRESERKNKLATEKRKENAVRELFYGKLTRFAGDLFDMLAEKQDDIEKVHNRMLTKYRNEAEKIQAQVDGEVDEFGRNIDPIDVLRKRMEEDQEDEMEEIEHEDLFSDVSRKFKSISRVCDRFLEWQLQYPEDYQQSQGDKIMGKICGAIAMAHGSVRLGWVQQVPVAARKEAIEASRAVELLEVFLRARWNVYSNVVPVENLDDYFKYGGDGNKDILLNAILWRVQCERRLVQRAELVIDSSGVLTKRADDIISKRAFESLKTLFGVDDPMSKLSLPLSTTTQKWGSSNSHQMGEAN